MAIAKGKKYRIKGFSKYFEDKYGTPNPTIRIEDTDQKVFGGSWGFQKGNPACLLFAMRSITDIDPSVNTLDGVYYGHINSLGELVHESELEELQPQP